MRTSRAFSLLFTTKNNGVKGEPVEHGRTGCPQGCPVAALCFQVVHLRGNGATGNIPISTIKHGHKWQQIHGAKITAAIYAIARVASTTIGFTPADVSAQSLQEENKLRSSWHRWTQTPPALSGGGTLTPCCATYTPRPRASRMSSPYKCFITETMCSFCLRTPTLSVTTRI